MLNGKAISIYGPNLLLLAGLSMACSNEKRSAPAQGNILFIQMEPATIEKKTELMAPRVIGISKGSFHGKK